ncbi:MAG: hypothetical protein EXS03_05865 [Phycisphaerales bacterium]|nr:hypothetical protein [Phycisphaerales bacterium]
MIDRHTVALFAAALVGGAALAQSDRPAHAPAIVPSVPTLDLDPTQRIDIQGWWSNGTEIILVQSDGAFLWWRQNNRFRPPTLAGRWDRQNYRTFWLEPYATGPSDQEAPKRLRAAMHRTDGTIFVDIGDHLGFHHSDTPPAAPEDAYVGRWLGPGGAIDLNADGSYDLRASAQAVTAPVTRAGHSGSWTYDGTFVVLRPTGSESDPVICTVVDRPELDPSGKPVPTKGSATKLPPSIEALTTPIGELRRLAPAPPTPKSPPAPLTPAVAPAPSSPRP